MQRVELDLEEEIELNLDKPSNELSNDFFLDDAFEVDIAVDNEETARFYPSDIDSSNFIEPRTSDKDKNVKIINTKKSNLFVNSLEAVPPEVYRKTLAETLTTTTTKLTSSLQEISTKLKFNENMYIGNQLETLLKASDKIGGKVNDTIIHEIYRNKNVSAKELFERVNPYSNNEAEFLVFEQQFNKIKEVMQQEQDKNNHISAINKKSSEILLVKILDVNLINRLFSYNKEFKFVRKFYTTNGLITHFKCECCSSEEHETKQLLEQFVYVINIASKDFSIILPLECKNCGTFHLLDPAVLKSISSKCSNIALSLKTTRTGNSKTNNNGMRSVMNIGIYSPNVDEVTFFLKNYDTEMYNNLSDEDEIDLDEMGAEEPNITNTNVSLSEVDDDWENIKKRFFDTISLIGDSKFKLVYSGFDASDVPSMSLSEEVNINADEQVVASIESPSMDYLRNPNRKFSKRKDLNLKNITKIYATMNGNYTFLKKMAVSSTINLLKPLGLNKFSLTSRSFYKVYSLFDNLDRLAKKELEFLSEELGFRIYNNDGSLNTEISGTLFEDIRYMNDNFELEKSRFVDSLYSNLYFLSYMPISSDKITDEDVNDYLYDTEIKSFVDRVSDLMILNNIAEDWLNRFNPALKNGLEKNMLISYKRTVIDSVRNMKRVDRKKSLWELLCKISELITSKPIESILRFIDSGDSMNYLCLFLDACYRKDLYDMYKCYAKIDGRFTSTRFKELEDLYQLLSAFPNKELDSDKFSFYFPNMNCDNKFKPRFVKMFEEKGFVPKHLEGNDEEEMLEYYSSLNYTDACVNYLPKQIEDLLNAFSSTIKFGRFISYSNLFKDFGVYYGARDLLYSLATENVPLTDILNSLNLSPELASMLLEDDYEFPSADDLVVKYIDLINLPLDGSLDVPSGTYRDRILFLLENFDDVKPMFKEFPKVYDLVIEIAGENE